MENIGDISKRHNVIYSTVERYYLRVRPRYLYKPRLKYIVRKMHVDFVAESSPEIVFKPYSQNIIKWNVGTRNIIDCVCDQDFLV